MRNRCVQAGWCLLLAGILSAGAAEFEVSGYYPSHAGVRRRLPVAEIDFSLYRTVYQSFLRFAPDGTLRPDAGLDSAGLIAAARGAGARVLISVGGGAFKQFADLCPDRAAAAALAGRIVAWAAERGYDGVDLDWEGAMDAEIGRRYGLLVRALRQRLDAAAEGGGRTRMLALTVLAGEWFLRHLDPALLAAADRVNLMAYDMNYRINAHHAPLRAPGGGRSTEQVLAFLTGAMGVAKSKIHVGLPFYGYWYENIAPGEPVASGGDPSRRRLQLAYADLLARLDGFTPVYDPDAAETVACSADGRRIARFDPPEGIRDKVRRVRELGCAGVFVWAIHQDRMPDGSAPLAEALAEAVGAVHREEVPQ